MAKLKVINLFAGPGAGKSTLRADLFGLMKKNQKDVEEVTEFAKDKTWEKNFSALSDQLFVLANQNRRLDRLKDQVEWVVSDSPILLGIHYKTPDYLPNTFEDLIFELWDTYENHNFFIERNHPYDPTGRNQNEEEARAIDASIIRMLDFNKIPFTKVLSGDTAHYQIYQSVFGNDIPKFSKDWFKFAFAWAGNSAKSEVQSMLKSFRSFIAE
jgi:hypothetical protein